MVLDSGQSTESMEILDPILPYQGYQNLSFREENFKKEYRISNISTAKIICGRKFHQRQTVTYQIFVVVVVLLPPTETEVNLFTFFNFRNVTSRTFRNYLNSYSLKKHVNELKFTQGKINVLWMQVLLPQNRK